MQIGDFHTDDKKCVDIDVDALDPRNVTVSKSNTSDMLYDFYVSEDRAVKKRSRSLETKCKAAKSRYLESREACNVALSQHVSEMSE